jgi:Xaa-Pro aminopeptidase
LVDAFGSICEAQDNTVRMLQPGASCAEIFAEHNAFMQRHGMHKEPRLHCHGQGYDVVERPMVRHDEDMALGTSMNIGLHPTFSNARLFVTVCDNFLIGPDGKIENIHHTPRKIFEL